MKETIATRTPERAFLVAVISKRDASRWSAEDSLKELAQ